MGIADDMRNLGREIIASFEARVERVGALKRETAELINSLHRGSEQRAREVGNMLGGFRTEQKAMASYWQAMAATMAKRRAGSR